jgi:cell wall-associated NlpC family hydrolase
LLEYRFPEVENAISLLPEDGSGDRVNGLVNNSVAHFRAAPSSRSELVTQALLGTPVRILKTVEGKRLVQAPDGYIGWVNESEVQALDAAQLDVFRESEKVIFNRQYGFSYSEPDASSLPVSDLVLGCLLALDSTDGDFDRVEYPDGRLAWVRSEEIIPAEEVFNRIPDADAVISSALAYHGIPYLWGGVSSKAIDCSGLTSQVFFINGILLPRDADQQSHSGSLIHTGYDTAGLKKGDLLFFGQKAGESQEEEVSHVSIYMGAGEFIHASGQKDRVGINSMDSTLANYIPEYPGIFVRATRIIGEEESGFERVPDNDLYSQILNFSE